MATEPQKAPSGTVTLRDRFTILLGSPLPDLATPHAQAFLVEEKRDSPRALFALIVRPGYPARLQVVRSLKGIECPGLMVLVDWGVVDWPPANRRVMAMIYERPLGGRVIPLGATECKRMDDADALRKVIVPLISALKVLKAQGVTHRAIRPSNLFYATAEKDRVVLGDAATTPAAYEQPVIFEPVESALAHPAGRGSGSPSDDVYSFGACLAALLQGRIPMATAADDAIIRMKVLQGSYTALVGEERLPLPMIEILRGTLCDDPHERWNNESLDLWLSGRRLSPLVAKIEKRAARDFTFNSGNFSTARELAIAMCRNWEAAAPYIIDGRLELWLRRSLDNKDKATAIGTLVGNAGAGDKRLPNDILVAKACMILDTGAPIRYRGLSLMPDGIGSYLALTLVEGGDMRVLAEALMREIPALWFQTRDAYNPDNSVLEGVFRAQKMFLDRGSIGFGIERVLYEMNESMPCISPSTVEDYVLELRDLLPALNAAAKKGEQKGWPVDRHVAAFIAARANFEIDRQMLDLSAPDPTRSCMGMLNLLAVIQWRLGQGALYALASWVGGLMQPAINTYHSREKRKSLEKEIPRMVREGSLVELSRLLDSAEDHHIDDAGFEQARQDWAAAQKEIRDIESGKVSYHDKALQMGQQLAALISVTISFITVTLLVIARVL